MIHLALTIAAFLFLMAIGLAVLGFAFGLLLVIFRSVVPALGAGISGAAAESVNAFKRQPTWIRLWVYALLAGFAGWAIAMVFAARR